MAPDPVAVTRPDASTRPDRPVWLDFEEFPFESRRMDIDGNQVHYIDEGSGDVLVFVHAGPAWLFVFRDLIRELRHGYRCLALDFPGTGLSEAAPGYVPALEPASVVLESFVGGLGLEDVTAVVHDLGGPVALGAAGKSPERFGGFCVLGSFGWPIREEFPEIARFIRLVDGRFFGAANTYLNLLAWLTSTKYGVGRRLSRAGRRVFRAPYASEQHRRYATAMLGSTLDAGGYLEGVLNSLRTDLADHPFLVVFGEGDEGRKAGFQARWEAEVPGARTAVVNGARHFPMADSPHLVSELIDRWHRDVV